MKLAALLFVLSFGLGGCVAVGAAGVGAWMAHDYGYHCYGPHKPAKWCRDHR